MVNSSAIGRTAASAFTLLEVLAAVTVLAMMMAFMFSLLGSSLTLWETGNKRIEAAQAARVGLNIMANDLKNAFAGNMTSFSSNGSAFYNIAPFAALTGNQVQVTGNLEGDAAVALGSDQLFGVVSTGNSTTPYDQFGYLSVFVTKVGGIDPMVNGRYYLVRQTTSPRFFYRNSPPNQSWFDPSNNSNAPIIDNCIRLAFLYYGNPTTNPATPPVWTPTWIPTDRLPLGVLVTTTVIDSRTAEKIAAITKDPLDGADITAGINAAAGSGSIASGLSTNATIQRLIAQGAVTVRRFIPFNRN